MSSSADQGDRPLVEFEFDQFQRYEVVRRVLNALYRERERSESSIRILDLGSGPERLTESFLPSEFVVTRADIETFGDETIVLIEPTAPLPFAAGAFEVVIALEVVEHVARRDRRQLLGECLRVAKDLFIFSCPDGRPDVVAAEARVASAFESMKGEEHPFLSEHATRGLPTEAEIRRVLDDAGFAYFVSANTPLDRWESVLMLDQALRTVEHGPEIVKSIYRRANSESLRHDALSCYRKFYVVAKAPAVSAAVGPVLHEQQPAARPDLPEPTFQLARLAAAELSERELQRLRAEEIAAAADEAARGARLEATAADEAARGARLAEKQARHAAAAAEQRVAAAETRVADAEKLVARLSADVERLVTTLALTAAGEPPRLRLVSAPRRLLEPAWAIHPYAAERSGRVDNVLGGGHSIWCFSAAASLVLRGAFDPGVYRVHAYVASPRGSRFIVEANSESFAAPPSGRIGRASVDIALHEAVHELRVHVDSSTQTAALIDLQVLARVEEPAAARIRRNAIDAARRRPVLLRLTRTRAGRAAARRVRRPAPPPSTEEREYERWIQERVAIRAALYPAPRERVPLSILTTVWNTPPAYLKELARTVLAQSYDDFEWILLDNGSTDQETIALLRGIVADDRIRFDRADENLGIVGGMRNCLERATGRYILPVDSDDLLYPDALAVFASALSTAAFPVIAYSDEDKVFDDRFLDAYLKPDWDPVLFLNSCYIAHLCAIDRERALELDVYSDRAAEGCHDWDTFVRFMLAGVEPAHVGEVLYTWRMHPQSAALNISSKNYLDASHVHVLQKFLEASAHPERYEIVRSPLWGPTPDWWFRRKRRQSRPIHTVALGQGGGVRKSYESSETIAALELSDDVAALEPFAELAQADGGLIRLAWNELKIHDEGRWDAIAVFELHPDTVVVGGRVLDAERRVLAAGEFFGFGGICGSPDIGRQEHDPGYFGQMWKQRSVSAVSTMLAFVEPSFLLESLRALAGEPVSLPFLGAWLGAAAALAGRRVVYTPFLVGMTRAPRADWNELITPEEQRAFAKRFAALLPESRYLSHLLSLDPVHPYAPSSEAKRQEVLARSGVNLSSHEPLLTARS